MPAELPSAAVADAGPLIHLDELSLLQLLNGFRIVRVPRTVHAEASRHRPRWRGRAPTNVSVEDPPAERFEAILDESSLDAGEAAALALWELHRESVLLCDDLPARRYAESAGCSVAGTVGLILWAARTERLDVTSAREVLRSLPSKTSLHIRVEILQIAIDSLDEL